MQVRSVRPDSMAKNISGNYIPRAAMPPAAQTPQVSKYKKRKIRELVGMSDVEVGAEARKLGLTKAHWYADSAAQYNAEVRAEQRERAAKINERRAAVVSRTRSQTHLQQQQQQVNNDDDEAGPSSGHCIGDFYWNHSATKQMMTSSERGATKLSEYSFMKTMPILENVYKQYPPYSDTILDEYEIRTLTAQLYQGSMLSTIRSRSFMARIRKDITESIPCKVTLKCFAMFSAFLTNEKGHELYKVFTQIITPQYEEVLNDRQIDEVVKEHFIYADRSTQQQSPSKDFFGYSG
jgi:hypothetical protein